MRLQLFIFVAFISSIGMAMADDNKPLSIYGRIKESVFKADLPNARIWSIGADGERADSIPLGRWDGMVLADGSSLFVFNTTRQDSIYVFEVECDGYMTQTVTYTIKNVGAREMTREMPIIYLDRAPHKLEEVTVTSSKIKFYNRGDTIVYNASAFQLAEGSMLDVLINQLPGAQLDDNGRITVNGEFVETLLLDGKPFFDGNNNIMLKNLGAYMVKSVEVYHGHTETEKWMNRDDIPKHLMMNVKLKKDYNIGYIANAQAGYGTEERYLGRLFSSFFTPTSRIALVGNFNNLNDTREPGQNDNWTPEKMPSGRSRHQTAGLNYRHETVDGKNGVNGNVIYDGDRLDKYTSTVRTNFFTAENTYGYSYATGHDRNTRVSTSNNAHHRAERYSVNGNLSAAYSDVSHFANGLSSEFNDEQTGMTMEMLNTIYSTGSEETLKSIINNSLTTSSSNKKTGNVNGFVNFIYKVPRTSDMITCQCQY